MRLKQAVRFLAVKKRTLHGIGNSLGQWPNRWLPTPALTQNAHRKERAAFLLLVNRTRQLAIRNGLDESILVRDTVKWFFPKQYLNASAS